jgi:aspartyl-tRNA synthetase
MLAWIFDRVKGIKVPTPFPRLTYAEAISRFGVDNPDVRFGLELVDLTDAAGQADFPPFKKVIAEGGVIKGINLAGDQLSRKELEALADDCRSFGVQAFSWIKVTSEQWASGAASHFPAPVQEQISQMLGLKEGQLVLMAGGAASGVNQALGRVRVKLANKFGLIPADQWRFLWITDFPLLEYSQEEGRFVSKHHPFTSPVEEDIPKLKTNLGQVRARAYDIVLNGSEIGGGSIRIHRRGMQEMMLETLGLDKREAEEKFGFLLEALEYGAPPHGGIALGLDRIVMMIVNAGSLRDVIAFPKTSKGVCLLTGAPDKVSAKQLKELSLKHISAE